MGKTNRDHESSQGPGSLAGLISPIGRPVASLERGRKGGFYAFPKRRDGNESDANNHIDLDNLNILVALYRGRRLRSRAMNGHINDKESRMKSRLKYSLAIPVLAALAMAACSDSHGTRASAPADEPPLNAALLAQGKDNYRNDTFGDVAFWTDVLGINSVISSAVDPTTALTV